MHVGWRRWTLGSTAATLVVAGCAPDYSPNTYASTAVQQASKVDQGVIVGVRQVGVSASGQTGAVTGAAAGGIAGAQTPGSVGSAFGALGGAVVGGIVGQGIEKATGETTAYEYIVRKPNGDLLSVTQRDAVALSVGQHVLLIAGSQARIVADYTQTVDEPRHNAQRDTQPVAPAPPPVVQTPLPAPEARTPFPAPEARTPFPAPEARTPLPAPEVSAGSAP